MGRSATEISRTLVHDTGNVQGRSARCATTQINAGACSVDFPEAKVFGTWPRSGLVASWSAGCSELQRVSVGTVCDYQTLELLGEVTVRRTPRRAIAASCQEHRSPRLKDFPLPLERNAPIRVVLNVTIKACAFAFGRSGGSSATWRFSDLRLLRVARYFSCAAIHSSACTDNLARGISEVNASGRPSGCI